jgi:hypothetical protein
MEGFLYTPPVDQIIHDLKHHFGDSMGNKIIEGSTKVEVSGSTLDELVIAQLMEHRDFLREELLAEEGGSWLHPDDITNHKKLIKSMSRIIEYFGGE